MFNSLIRKTENERRLCLTEEDEREAIKWEKINSKKQNMVKYNIFSKKPDRPFDKEDNNLQDYIYFTKLL